MIVSAAMQHHQLVDHLSATTTTAQTHSEAHPDTKQTNFHQFHRQINEEENFSSQYMSLYQNSQDYHNSVVQADNQSNYIQEQHYASESHLYQHQKTMAPHLYNHYQQYVEMAPNYTTAGTYGIAAHYSHLSEETNTFSSNHSHSYQHPLIHSFVGTYDATERRPTSESCGQTHVSSFKQDESPINRSTSRHCNSTTTTAANGKTTVTLECRELIELEPKSKSQQVEEQLLNDKLDSPKKEPKLIERKEENYNNSIVLDDTESNDIEEFATTTSDSSYLQKQVHSTRIASSDPKSSLTERVKCEDVEYQRQLICTTTANNNNINKANKTFPPISWQREEQTKADRSSLGSAYNHSVGAFAANIESNDHGQQSQYPSAHRSATYLVSNSQQLTQASASSYQSTALASYAKSSLEDDELLNGGADLVSNRTNRHSNIKNLADSPLTGTGAPGEYNQLRILEMRKEKSRDAARSRRSKENHEFYELAKLLPLPAAITSQLDFLDKASIIRLTISFLKLRQFSVNGYPPWAPDFTTLGSANPYSSQSLKSNNNYLEQHSSYLNESLTFHDSSVSSPTSSSSRPTSTSNNTGQVLKSTPSSHPANQLNYTSEQHMTNSRVAFQTPLDTYSQHDQHTKTLAPLKTSQASNLFDVHQGTHILQSLDGFAFAIGRDGRFLYISETVSMYLGLSQVEMTGSSVFDYTHQNDHEELARQLGIPCTSISVQSPANETPRTSNLNCNSPAEPASVRSQYSIASNETIIEDHINHNPKKRFKSEATNSVLRGSYTKVCSANKSRTNKHINVKVETQSLDSNGIIESSKETTGMSVEQNEPNQANGTFEDPLVRQFCIRMKSTLTKRGCQHFKSSGYRVVHIVAHLRSYQSNDHGHLMDPLDESGGNNSGGGQTNQSSRIQAKRRGPKVLPKNLDGGTRLGELKFKTSINQQESSDTKTQPESSGEVRLQNKRRSGDRETSVTSTATLMPKIIGMVAVAIALPPPSINELRLESDTFVFRLGLDLKISHIEPKITDLLQFPIDMIVGQSLYSLVHPADVQQVQNCHKELLRKGQMMSGYYRLLARTGGYIWIQTCATLICNNTSSNFAASAALTPVPMNSPLVSATPSDLNRFTPSSGIYNGGSNSQQISATFGLDKNTISSSQQQHQSGKIVSPGFSGSHSEAQDQEQCVIFVNYMVTDVIESKEILDICQSPNLLAGSSMSTFSGDLEASNLTVSQTNSNATLNQTSDPFNSSSSPSYSSTSSLKSPSNYLSGQTGAHLSSHRRNRHNESGEQTKLNSLSNRSAIGRTNSKSSGSIQSSNHHHQLQHQSPYHQMSDSSLHLQPSRSISERSADLGSSADMNAYGTNSADPANVYVGYGGLALNKSVASDTANVAAAAAAAAVAGWPNAAATLGDAAGVVAYAAAAAASASSANGSSHYRSIDRQSQIYKAAFGLASDYQHHSHTHGQQTHQSHHSHHQQQQHQQVQTDYQSDSYSSQQQTAAHRLSSSQQHPTSSWDTVAAVHHHLANPYVGNLDTAVGHHQSAHLSHNHHSTTSNNHHQINSSAAAATAGSYYNYYGYYG